MMSNRGACSHFLYRIRLTLLPFLVPHGDDQDQDGRNGRLKDPQQRPTDHQAGVAARGRHASQDHAPQHDVDAEVFTEPGDALGEVLRGELRGQEADVEHHGDVGVVLALQVGVGAQAHDRGVRDGRLVQELQEVGRHHAGDDHEVDLADQLLQRAGVGQDRHGLLAHRVGIGVVAQVREGLVSVFGRDVEGLEGLVEVGRDAAAAVVFFDVLLVHDGRVELRVVVVVWLSHFWGTQELVKVRVGNSKGRLVRDRGEQ